MVPIDWIARKFAPPVVFSSLLATLSGGHSTGLPSIPVTDTLVAVGFLRKTRRMPAAIARCRLVFDQQGCELKVRFTSSRVHG